MRGLQGKAGKIVPPSMGIQQGHIFLYLPVWEYKKGEEQGCTSHYGNTTRTKTQTKTRGCTSHHGNTTWTWRRALPRRINTFNTSQEGVTWYPAVYGPSTIPARDTPRSAPVDKHSRATEPHQTFCRATEPHQTFCRARTAPLNTLLCGGAQNKALDVL